MGKQGKKREEGMMATKEKKQDKKPFNHVLEVQNGFIDIRDLYKHFNENLLKEKKDGKKLSR